MTNKRKRQKEYQRKYLQKHLKKKRMQEIANECNHDEQHQHSSDKANEIRMSTHKEQLEKLFIMASIGFVLLLIGLLVVDYLF